MTHQQEQSSLMQAFAAMPPGQRTALPIHLFPRRRQTPVDENSRPERADFAPLARGDTFQQRHIGGQIMTSGGKLANAFGRLQQYHVAASYLATGSAAPSATGGADRKGGR